MNRTRILLADDHTMFTDVLVNVLRKDFDVIGVARDGGTMVEMAKRTLPDLIVADVAMPTLSGIEAAHMLQRETSSAKVLFLSMHADFSIVEEAFRAGASGYMLKTGGVD